MQNNGLIFTLKEIFINQLKVKNFSDTQRLPFYQALSKTAQDFVATLNDENDKKSVTTYVKNFIKKMSTDETLTPQKALQSFEEDVAKQKQLAEFVFVMCQELKNENFDNNNRIPFYNKIVKIAKQYEEETNQTEISPFIKNFIREMSNDDNITSIQAIENLEKQYAPLANDEYMSDTKKYPESVEKVYKDPTNARCMEHHKITFDNWRQEWLKQNVHDN